MTVTVFVTGTDTGVGKTLVSRALIEYWVANGYQTSGFKPVASGAEKHHFQLRNEDALLLMSAANTDLPYETVNPCVYATATAPHIAADYIGEQIDINRLTTVYQQVAASSERIVVEGAGGWQVPLTLDISFADWVAQHMWPVILVVNIKLGCLNHAKLTARDIQRYGLPLAGWVANRISPDVEFHEAMIATLRAALSAPLLGIIPPLQQQGINPNPASFLHFDRLALTS